MPAERASKQPPSSPQKMSAGVKLEDCMLPSSELDM